MKTLLTFLFFTISLSVYSQQINLKDRPLNPTELNTLHLVKKYHSFFPLSSNLKELYIDSNDKKYVIEKQFFKLNENGISSFFCFNNDNSITFSYKDSTIEYSGYTNVINNDVYTLINYITGSLSTVKMYKNGVLMK